jgi:hypothetical protein
MAEFIGFELKEFDTALLTANYQSIGSVLLKAAKRFQVFNNSDVDVYLSIEGVDADMRIPARRDLDVYAIDADFRQSEGSYALRAGKKIKIKQVTAAAAGSVIIHMFT